MPGRLSNDESHSGFDDLSSSEPFALLFRATNGASDKTKKVKISTTVDSSELEEFWQKYTDVVKVGMGGLKKKDKKRQKKKAASKN
ncbi:hypothetical protein TRICI_006600 [Trichomonascus ciferrii]|uniref:Signal recognition particle subunit SRP14 n=1 Tax=Trichomonascus ciferrii TaxID=44093 RepID=A0A642UID7_9ASCO|nr:hypothetical protein TRICI_006600 [Trichomonascus ciferrii]